MRRSNEPIAWSLFGAGGMVLALLGPAAIVVSGLLLPFYFADSPQDVYRLTDRLLTHLAGKLFVFLFVALTLYHTAHRLYHGLNDLHVRGPRMAWATLFYGGATLLALVCGALLLRAGW